MAQGDSDRENGVGRENQSGDGTEETSTETREHLGTERSGPAIVSKEVRVKVVDGKVVASKRGRVAKKSLKGLPLTARQQQKALELKRQGASTYAISNQLEKSWITVQKFLNQFEGLEKLASEAREYQGIKGEVLDAAQWSMVKSALSPEKVEAATLRDCAYAFKEFHAAGRLERGLSTKNVASISFTVANVLPSNDNPSE